MVCLIIVSSLAEILSRSRLGFVRLVTRLAKARVGQVSQVSQVSQVIDQVAEFY